MQYLLLFSLLLTDTVFMGEEAKMWFGWQTRKAKNSVTSSWKEPVHIWTDAS